MRTLKEIERAAKSLKKEIKKLQSISEYLTHDKKLTYEDEEVLEVEGRIYILQQEVDELRDEYREVLREKKQSKNNPTMSR
jgi:flavoprotein